MMDSLPSLSDLKRHYKKDSRFVNDLYTLTYDNHESLDSVELFAVFDKDVSENKCKLNYSVNNNFD